MFYIVFGSVKRPRGFMGGSFLDWSQPPIGVYQAGSAKEACHAAAKDHGQMATYFAVEGFAWGIDLMEASASQLGRSATPEERMGQILDRMEQNDERIRQLQAAGDTAKSNADRLAEESDKRLAEIDREMDEMDR